jgi:hypothetical protein
MVVLALITLAACNGTVGESATPSPEPSNATPIPSGREAVAPWHLEMVDGDRLVIRVEVGEPVCEQVARVEIDESADTVRLTAVTTILKVTACPQLRNYEPVNVTLEAPLGNRDLLGCLLERAPASDPRTSCNETIGES